MLRVGLTGNIASGKSTVLELFKRWGASTIDADQLSRDAVVPGSAALAAIARHFGAALLKADGTLDRTALRHRIMNDAADRSALNAIVHPEVARLMAAQEADLRRAGARLVVHDVPLLFEVLEPASFDLIVLVDAPASVRRQRLIQDRGLAAAEADALMATQLPSDAKRGRSHFVIDNSGDRTALEAAARGAWSELQERARLA